MDIYTTCVYLESWRWLRDACDVAMVLVGEWTLEIDTWIMNILEFVEHGGGALDLM